MLKDKTGYAHHCPICSSMMPASDVDYMICDNCVAVLLHRGKRLRQQQKERIENRLRTVREGVRLHWEPKDRGLFVEGLKLTVVGIDNNTETLFLRYLEDD